MELEDIKKLANLARIDMDDTEMLTISKDFGAILAYVGQIKEVSSRQDADKEEDFNKNTEDYFLHNITREDIATNTRGEYTDKIMKNAPEVQDGFLKVKQIL